MLHGRVVVAIPGVKTENQHAAVARSESAQAILSIIRSFPAGVLREWLRDALPNVPKRTRNRIIKALLQQGLIQESLDERGQRRLLALSQATPPS